MPMLTIERIGSPVEPRHSPLRTRVGEDRHAVEDLVDLGDDVGAVDDERVVAGPAQRGVQRGAVLGGVDVLAGEQRGEALVHLALARRGRRAASMVAAVTRCFE